jgi:acyl-CoA reductase-like NAD-dependent aldehyde dehydrogenase
VRPEMVIMRGETFGPVTPVLPVASLEEAIDLANDSRYGLSAYVFSRDCQSARTASGACCATRRSRPPTTTTARIAQPHVFGALVN